MTMKTFNSSDNINIAHAISLWFDKDFGDSYVELGDCVVDSVSLSPEFIEFNSYRNARNSLRKKILNKNSAEVSVTLNEPNITNIQRVIYGGAVSTSQTATALEGRVMTTYADTAGLYVDFTDDTNEPTVSDVTVTGIYLNTDVLEASAITPTNAAPDTNGCVYLPATDVSAGDSVYVKYSVAYTGMYKTEIFGSTDSTIEGACKLQARNTGGGIVQLWDIAAVTLAPNGDLTYPLDTWQTVPITLTLAERGGTWGHIYMS